MKKLTYFLSLFLVTGLLLAGCNKKSEEEFRKEVVGTWSYYDVKQFHTFQSSCQSCYTDVTEVFAGMTLYMNDDQTYTVEDTGAVVLESGTWDLDDSKPGYRDQNGNVAVAQFALRFSDTQNDTTYGWALRNSSETNFVAIDTRELGTYWFEFR